MNLFVTFLSLHAAAVVVDGLWQGALVAVTVALVLRLLPGIRAAQRFMIWAAAFALAVALPLLPVAARPVSVAAPRLQLGMAWGVALALLWAAMVLVRSVRLGLEALRVRKIWRSAQPVGVDAGVLAVLEACPRQPQICISDQVDAPSVIGFFSPRLLIPAAMMQQITQAELLHIALHECEHLRRRDDWLNLLQKVAVALFPLNPALLWVDQRLGLERELACDAGVVASTGAALDYAECLTRLAEHRFNRHRVVLALSAWARRPELTRRVYTLLQPVRRISRAGTAGAIVVMACALLATSDGIVHAPALVSFSSPEATGTAAPLEPLAPSAALPVVFHATARQPHAAYVSTIAHMPSRRPVRVRNQRRPEQQAPRLLDTSAPRLARASEPRMVDLSAPRDVVPAYFVPVRFSYSYAAVPFGDGWLIVQL